MNSKRYLIISLVFTFLLIFSACDNNRNGTLSLDVLRDLAQNGKDLTWKDFEAYPYEDIGSGLHIRKYEIDGDYHVLVGGGSINKTPLYIHLVKKNGEKIDIRYDDIDPFILNE